MQLFSSCGERGSSAVQPARVAGAPGSVRASHCGTSLVAEHRLAGTWLQQVPHRAQDCGLQTPERKLRNGAAWAQLLLGIWTLPGPGIEPMSPVLAGRFFTTEPPGRPQDSFKKMLIISEMLQ